MAEFEWAQSFATSSYGTVSYKTPAEEDLAQTRLSTTFKGSFASFVCHVVNLENKFRSHSPIVLDNSSKITMTPTILGQGTTFMVRRARWLRDPKEPIVDVALKEIISATLPMNTPTG